MIGLQNWRSCLEHPPTFGLLVVFCIVASCFFDVRSRFAWRYDDMTEACGWSGPVFGSQNWQRLSRRAGRWAGQAQPGREVGR